ncbi:LacI family DNA-binding transcriptional regulator [Treponema sp.]|uniref:LacI family DNA-binding transcriptional regulator n=1 Tax=Treponema sp. TaxID=166 RepID=UPI00388E1F0B
MSVTIKDIALKAGVSRGTVDRVLHNRAGVNPEVAEKIRKLADEMGFVPNKAGKILAARKQPIKFACLLPARAKPFFEDVIKGFKRAQKELSDYGVTVDVSFVKDFKTESHVKAINKLEQNKYSGLCLTTLDTPEVQLTVHNIIEKGIPVVSVNTDIPDSGRICYVGTDYARSGKTAAGMLCLTTSDRLEILVITGSYNIRGHKERIRGFVEGLEEHKIKHNIVTTIESEDDDETAYVRTLDALKATPGINCVFIAAAGVGGVCRALKKLNRTNTHVVVFDETPSTKEFIHSGLIKFTIGQEPEMQGYMGIMRLFSWLMEEGKRSSTDYITQTIIKIRENIAE